MTKKRTPPIFDDSEMTIQAKKKKLEEFLNKEKSIPTKLDDSRITLKEKRERLKKGLEELEKIKKDIFVEFIEKQEEKKLIYGIVLEPDTPDFHNDFFSPEEIENTCHNYMLKSQTIGDSHIKDADAKIVESYIAPVDFKIGNQEVKKGSWVLVTKIFNDQLWKSIKKGEYTGYSVGGYGIRIPSKGGE